MADGALSFVSWVRRGLATAMQSTEGDTPGPEALALVEVQFNNDASLSADARLALIAPGDVVGLDSSVIVRTWPKSDDFDAEFASYALIEFDQADLPWRYTPARNSGTPANADDRLRPWFSLLVIESSEGSITPPTPAQKIAVLNVNDVNNLPSTSNLWAWAHTQFEGENVTDPEQAKQKITGEPGLFTARLMSPRLLLANKEYLACLVPTFERGRLVGLEKLADNANTDALAGWNLADTPFQLPVYFFWRFRTGSIANFEHAARLIKPFVLPETVGRRDMDVSDPGLGLREAATGSLPAEGALMSVAAFEQGPPEWPATERDAFIAELKALLNAPAAPTAVEPVLAPPLYAEWYAAQNGLDQEAPQGTNPPWFFQLNSDPRNRVGSALGTKVIQNEQQALLAGGWDQVEEILSINDKLRIVQLGRGIVDRIYTRHFRTAVEQRFYHLTRRVHAQVTCGTGTVCGHVRGSPITPAFLSAQWVRWSRPQGALGRLQGRPELTDFVPNLLRQLNDCKRPAPEPSTPGGLHDTGNLPLPGGLPCNRLEDLIGLGPSDTLYWGLLILWVSRQLLVSQNGDCWWIAIKAMRFAVGLILIAINADDMRRRCRFQTGTLTVQDILNSPQMPNFTGYVTLPDPLPAPSAPGPSGSVDNAQAAAVRAALAVLLEALAPPPVIACPPSMDLDACRIELENQLRPSVTVGRRVTDRIALDPSVEWDPADPLEPMLFTPEFERPMYEPLNQISSDWILPGINQMQRDSVGLAVTNQKFVEAYMAGLNHEMTRELLWNEFPTDQRGTYFRQFWSIAGHILENGSTLPPDQLRDIKAIRLWSKTANLGKNSPRPPPGDDEDEPFLVLVVRAQLIQKYPNVIVYAQRLDAATQTLTGSQEHPIFYALLEPDTAFYGFQLTATEIRDDPSWYFVLQEQPGEPKFADEDTPRASNKYTADPTQFGNSAGIVAEKTFHQPFRLGIQGTALLPPATP